MMSTFRSRSRGMASDQAEDPSHSQQGKQTQQSVSGQPLDEITR